MWPKHRKHRKEEAMTPAQALRNTQDASQALHAAADHLDWWVQKALAVVREQQRQRDRQHRGEDRATE